MKQKSARPQSFAPSPPAGDVWTGHMGEGGERGSVRASERAAVGEGTTSKPLAVREGSMAPYIANQLNKRWRIAKIGEIFRTVGGGTPATSNPEFWAGDVPWITSADIDDAHVITPRRWITKKAVTSSATNLVPKGSIVVVTRVGLGKVAVAPEQLCFSQDCQALLFDPAVVDSRFVVLQLSRTVQVFKHISRGTTISGVTKKQLLEQDFLLPSLAEQRRIVAELETQLTRLDASVITLKRVQANLKRYRASVLKAACEGRLVPTEAELARREGRSYESGVELLSSILEQREKGEKKSNKRKQHEQPNGLELTQLPDGWVWSSLGQCFAVGVGATPSRKESGYWNGDIPWVSSGEIQFGRITETHEHITTAGLENSSTKLNPSGSVLLAMIGQGRTRGQAALLEIEAANNQNCAAIWVGKTPIPPKFVYHWLMGRYEETRTRGSGNNQQALNKSLVEQIPLPLPPLVELIRIVAEAERRLSVIEELEATVASNLKRAEWLRQSVLQKAFTQPQPSVVATAQRVATEPAVKKPNQHFLRVVLSGEIVHRLHAEPTFGRTKHQKIFHLCEHIAAIEGLNGQYHREAAGPLDNKLIYANEAELKKQQWYAEVKRDGYGHAYKPLGKAGDHEKYLERYWPDQLAVIRKLVEQMRRWDTERCEIFSTTYAAWNDLLIWKRAVTDEAILHEILHRWHEKKRRISEDRWRKAIAWIRREGYEPTGFGRQTCAPA